MNRYAIALLAGVAGVSLASAASAADLIISEPAPIVPIVETAGGNWDGVYVGAFAGFGWGTLTEEDGYLRSGWHRIRGHDRLEARYRRRC